MKQNSVPIISTAWWYNGLDTLNFPLNITDSKWLVETVSAEMLATVREISQHDYSKLVGKQACVSVAMSCWDISRRVYVVEPDWSIYLSREKHGLEVTNCSWSYTN